MKLLKYILLLFFFECACNHFQENKRAVFVKDSVEHAIASAKTQDSIQNAADFARRHDSIYQGNLEMLTKGDGKLHYPGDSNITDSIAYCRARISEDENGLGFYYWKDGEWKSFLLDDEVISSYNEKTLMTTMQMDGKGHKEIIIHENRWIIHSYGDTLGGWEYSYSSFFIFNVDTDTLLFSATDKYGAGEFSNQSESYSGWEYGLHLAQNEISIDSLTFTQDTITPTEIKPDHKPGRYIIRNGKYVLAK